MRHRIKGRKLGRNSPHRRALFRSLSRAVVLTCGGARNDGKGRIQTTLAKAKELRPFLERLVTIAVKAKLRFGEARDLACSYARGTAEWKAWRITNDGLVWVTAQAEYIHLYRMLFDVVRSREVVRLLIEVVAPRFVGRPGGYTRVVRIAKRRLADGAQLAMIEFVGGAVKLDVDR